MTTTTQLRDWWAPACEGPFVKIALHGAGTVSVEPTIADAVHALSACLEAHSYESRAADTGAYNCRQITGGTRYSLHAYGIAIDINWVTNPYGPVLVTDMPAAMVEAIKAIRTVNGKQVWRWGGDYGGNKDAMHYEITCHPADLATGIFPGSVPNNAPDPAPDPAPAPPPEDVDLMYKIVWIKSGSKPGAAYRVLFAKGKDGKDFPVEAHDIDGDDLAGWRKRLEEVPSSKPLPPSPFIRIVDGPYANV